MTFFEPVNGKTGEVQVIRQRNNLVGYLLLRFVIVDIILMDSVKKARTDSNLRI